ncbi:MAG: ABC transporter permease subunit [Polyangiaceae bacterium]|nr:ABC transporter permease subunit [Myxococcales bacterium]MCB9588949.1 ABC transporter permease subunit [Polyangiaceae bacterium]MCB9609273.1 ABC transporter permease subunit [Polyangiaceae bacterium]
MNAFMAIVGDTWRQSKQQIVFFILAGLLLLTGIGFIAGFKVKTNDADEKVLGFPFGGDKAQLSLDLLWDAQYRELIHQELGHDKVLKEKSEAYDATKARFEALARNPSANQDDIQKANDDLTEQRKDLKALQQKQSEEAQEVVENRTKNLNRLDKGVEMWLHWAVEFLFKFSMWIFIAGCAGYFPNMLSAGAVDILVSKPVTRAQLFFGKFLGGLVLYAALITAVYFVVFLGVGIRTGVWHLRFFAGIPTTIFAAALLYSIVGWIGVFTRSTAFAIITGYLFYFIIDTFVGWTQKLGDVFALEEGFNTLKSISDFAKIAFPGFDRLEDAAAATVMNVPIWEFQPFLVASLWMAICLGTAYWRFQKLDF